MKKIITYSTILTFLILSGCKERQLKGAFQGAWYKDGFDMEAFTVRGDSIYFPGLDKGYLYELDNDTLFIHFSEKKTQSKILKFSSRRMTVWDMSITDDTILLQREPSPFLDSIPAGVVER